MTDRRILYLFWSDPELLRENRLVKLPQQLLHYFFFPLQTLLMIKGTVINIYIRGYEGRRDAWTACKKVSEGGHGDVSCGYFSASGCFEAPAGALSSSASWCTCSISEVVFDTFPHTDTFIYVWANSGFGTLRHTRGRSRGEGSKAPCAHLKCLLISEHQCSLKANNLIRMNH